MSPSLLHRSAIAAVLAGVALLLCSTVAAAVTTPLGTVYEVERDRLTVTRSSADTATCTWRHYEGYTGATRGNTQYSSNYLGYTDLTQDAAVASVSFPLGSGYNLIAHRHAAVEAERIVVFRSGSAATSVTVANEPTVTVSAMPDVTLSTTVTATIPETLTAEVSRIEGIPDGWINVIAIVGLLGVGWGIHRAFIG